MNMMTPTAETQNATGKLPRNRPALGGRRTVERFARQDSTSTATGLAESVQSVKEELDAVRREDAKLRQALYEAAQVQRRLCAPRELVWGEFEIAGESFPVRHLSGDFFKVMELDSVLGLSLGDIAGKGLSAGIWQAHLMDLIQRCARTCPRPADAVAEVNRELCQDRSEPPITALFFARLDPARNELVYCNAGLPPPLLLGHNRSVERLEKGGPMLGALQNATYEAGCVRMNPGDMLLAYSDGLTECQNSQEEEFETERLSAVAKGVSGASATQVLFHTLGAVLDFAGASSPGDDLTLLIVRRRETTRSEETSAANKNFSESRNRLTSVVRTQAGRERRGKPSQIAGGT
jgi:serine phosphatase RsbU (regulator of sigma subunit)